LVHTSLTYTKIALVRSASIYARLVVLESGLGLEFIFGLGLGLGLELKGLGLGLRLGSFFLQVL